MLQNSLFVRRLLVCLAVCLACAIANAQSVSDSTATRLDYAVELSMKKADITGICIITQDEEQILGGIVNEFGVSFMTFSYDRKKEKVKLIDVTPKLNKWYIKRVLRKDLKKIIQSLPFESHEYENKRYKIRYKFTKLIATDETEQSAL